jgi:hypothetical protein
MPSPASAALDVNLVLRQYEKYGGLGLNWRMFGSSGHLTRPKLPVAEAYTACFPADHDGNNHVKAIGNTWHIKRFSQADPHSIELINATAHPMVNELGQPYSGPFTKTPSFTKIALFHYVTKSGDEFAQKIARSSPTCNRKTWQLFEQWDQQATATSKDAFWISKMCGMQRVVDMQRQWITSVGMPRGGGFVG